MRQHGPEKGGVSVFFAAQRLCSERGGNGMEMAPREGGGSRAWRMHELLPVRFSNAQLHFPLPSRPSRGRGVRARWATLKPGDVLACVYDPPLHAPFSLSIPPSPPPPPPPLPPLRVLCFVLPHVRFHLIRITCFWRHAVFRGLCL